MTPALAEVHTEIEARSPRELAPLIKEQIQLGDLAADEAGMPYYRKAGGLLLEAQISKKSTGEYSQEWFEEYCNETTGKSVSSCHGYIRAHKQHVAAIEDARESRKKNKAFKPKLSGSLSDLLGHPKSGRVLRGYQKEVDKAVEAARKQQLKAAEDRASEQKRKQELARKLIDIGFKVLAKELHPDKMGGNKDAMSRLNEVRKRLMAVYG